LQERFRASDPGERVWTWSADHSVGFWQRMQAIGAAVHRWDAENAVRAPKPLDAALAADAVGQTFEVMAPMWRAVAKAPAGQGERFLFTRTTGLRRGWCSSTAMQYCSARLTVTTAFKYQAQRLTWRFSSGSVWRLAS
jgi:hypothetical protein